MDVALNTCKCTLLHTNNHNQPFLKCAFTKLAILAPSAISYILMHSNGHHNYKGKGFIANALELSLGT